MGNYPSNEYERVRLIASAKTWIEGDAIQQLNYVASLPAMRQVVGLPDLHPGRGYPVGMACLSEGHFYPALVGNDIGCGMAMFQTDVPVRKVKLDKWEKKIRQAAFIDQVYWEEVASQRLNGDVRNIGTIGGGNHFAEFQKIANVYDEEIFESIGIEKSAIQLLVHSGSRGLGQSILRNHVDRFGHAGLSHGSPEAIEYMTQHDSALAWARLNRQVIGERLSRSLDIDIQLKLEVHHNFVAPLNEFGSKAWLHRKGATPADVGLVIIPGSRGDSSYLVLPKPSRKSLYSLAHGAGRKWQRSECEGRLKNRYQASELLRAAMGSRVICDDRTLLYEEAPEAYKRIDSVIRDLLDADLIQLVAELVPVLTYKNQSSERKAGCHHD